MSEAWVDDGRPGVGRLNYFVGKVGIAAGMLFLVTWLGPGNTWVKVVGLILSYVSFALEVARLRCIGLSQWWAMLRFVPYMNLLYMIFLQSAPAGWAETRRFDRTGKTLMIFQLGLLALMIYMLLKMKMAVPYFI